MKKTLIILFTALLLTACSSDSSSPKDGLPPETQIGANTFGCLINGKLYLPRCEEPSVVFPNSAMILEGSYPSIPNSNQIIVKDLKSTYYFEILIHINELKLYGVTNYTIDESNGENSIDGLHNNYINCILYDNVSKTYKLYVSYENCGNIQITRYTVGSNNPPTGTIVSGTFNGTLQNFNDNNDKIEITNGRFDVNGLTCTYKEFP